MNAEAEFWDAYVAYAEAGDLKYGKLCARINHRHYVIAPEQPADYKGFLGFGGSEFRIDFVSGPHKGKHIVTHNLWTVGEIPHEFWDRLPDNAEFMK